MFSYFSKRMWFVTAFILFTGQILFAHPNSSLLWKISGNGLKKPSYLYGKGHSFDERVFRFASLV